MRYANMSQRSCVAWKFGTELIQLPRDWHPITTLDVLSYLLDGWPTFSCFFSNSPSRGCPILCRFCKGWDFTRPTQPTCPPGCPNHHAFTTLWNARSEDRKLLRPCLCHY